MKRILTLVLVALFAVSAASCARQPSAKTAEHKIKKFFVKYGKNYPETEYGKNKATDVDILGQEEIHKNLVATQALVTLGTSEIKKVSVTIEKKAWVCHIVSWENIL